MHYFITTLNLFIEKTLSCVQSKLSAKWCRFYLISESDTAQFDWLVKSMLLQTSGVEPLGNRVLLKGLLFFPGHPTESCVSSDF